MHIISHSLPENQARLWRNSTSPASVKVASHISTQKPATAAESGCASVLLPSFGLRSCTLCIGIQAIDAEASDYRGYGTICTSEKDGYKFGKGNVRVEFKIQARPVIEIAGKVGPFFYRAEAVAHVRNIGRCCLSRKFIPNRKAILIRQ